MQKLAALTNYTPASASVTLGNIKRKIKLVEGNATDTSTKDKTSDSGSAAPPPSTPPKKRAPASGSASSTPRKNATPKSTGKRGRRGKEAGHATDATAAAAADPPQTPTKRQKKAQDEAIEEGMPGALYYDEDDEIKDIKVKKEMVEDGEWMDGCGI